MTAFELWKGQELRPTILSNCIAFLSQLGEKKNYRVEITEIRDDRTLQQNKALFGYAYPLICEQTGYDADDLHAAFCKKFFGETVISIMGEVVRRPNRTTTTNEAGKRDVMNWEDFAKFYTMVERIADESGVKIPPPNPLWKNERFNRDSSDVE